MIERKSSNTCSAMIGTKCWRVFGNHDNKKYHERKRKEDRFHRPVNKIAVHNSERFEKWNNKRWNAGSGLFDASPYLLLSDHFHLRCCSVSSGQLLLTCTDNLWWSVYIIRLAKWWEHRKQACLLLSCSHSVHLPSSKIKRSNLGYMNTVCGIRKSAFPSYIEYGYLVTGVCYHSRIGVGWHLMNGAL